MPTLRSVSCQIQWAETNTPFQEYGTVYGDGVVETYIAVPDKPQPFSIRLTSKKFIYEGLAAAVFIDGTYQCNRNRVNLIPAKKGIPRERIEIDFIMRQKEKAIGDGTYMGRQWRFDDHNIVPDPPKKSQGDHWNDLGTIEIIVMRCRARDSDDTNASTASSAEESQILDTAMGSGEDSETEDDAKSIERGEAGKGPKVESVPAEEEGGMFGLFDGAADHPYGPSPYWTRRPPHHSNHPYFKRGYDDYAAPHEQSYPRHMPYGPPPPPGEAPRKHVHFDHGPLRHHVIPPPPPPPQPPGWEDRYSDQVTDHRHGRQPHPPPQAYTPGIGEWQHTYYNGTGHPQSHHPPPTAPPTSRTSTSSASRSPSVPDPPAASHTQQGWTNLPNNRPPHYNQYSTYPTAFPQQAAPPFPPYPVYVSQPYAAPYPAVPPTVWPSSGYHVVGQGIHPFAGQRNSSGSSVSPKSQPRAAKQGSMDSAKDKNNSQDDWGPTPSSGDNAARKQNDDNADNPNEDNNDWNTSGNDNAGNSWDNSDGNNQEGNQNSNGDNEDTNNQDTGWSNDNQGGGWDQPKNSSDLQPAGADASWGAEANNTSNNIASNATPAAGWNAQNSVHVALTTITTPGARPLYGPHGVYYATQSTIAADAPCDAEEEPRYDVPQSFANEYGSRKQVQPGKGYLYVKKRCSPEYIDDMRDPYARFIFKYRTKEELKKELDIELDAEPSGNEEVQKFQNVSKDDLIAMLLRAQGALGGRIPSPPPQAANADPNVVDPSEPVAVEPPNVSHLNYALPDQRSAVGAGYNNTDNAVLTTAPISWQETTSGAKAGEQKQESWEDNYTGEAAWGSFNAKQNAPKSGW